MTDFFENDLAVLREQYTGFESRDAIPLPVTYLEDLEVHLISGEPIEVPKDVALEGLRVRRIIEAIAKTARQCLPQERVGNASMPAVEAMSKHMLADFYVQQQIASGRPVLFVAGELILPVSEDDDGMAGDRAEVIQ